MPLNPPPDRLENVILPFFPIDSGTQLKSIMFAAPSGFANVSGVLPSGEANFLDFSQVETIINKGTYPVTIPDTFNNPTTHSSQSIVAPIGLEYYQSKQFIKEPPYYTESTVNGDGSINGIYIQALSNSKATRDYSINDFSIFNKYVHYDSSGLTPPASDLLPAEVGSTPHMYAFTFDPSTFISLGVTRFNFYSKQYRT